MKGKYQAKKTKSSRRKGLSTRPKQKLLTKLWTNQGGFEDPVEDKDSTDGLGDTIKDIFQPIFDEFKDLIGENEDKKSFIGGLIKIFTIRLSSRSTTLAKILKSHKNKHKNCTRLMARTKATVRRLRQPTFVAAPGQRNGNKNFMNRRNSMFKIKTLLPQTLQVEVKKMAKF